MKILSTITLSFLCFMTGLTWYAYQKEWIIILLPHQTTHVQAASNANDTTFSQQKITLFFWKHQEWHKEQISIIWSFDLATNIKTITHNWITLLEDEKLIDTDIQLLSAIVTGNKELFLSYNKNLFHEQSSTYDKLMLIHSLLKTLHENKILIQSVRFLVHHQIMNDDHLNFSISWPITGYMTNL